jgi:hypothetical protein
MLIPKRARLFAGAASLTAAALSCALGARAGAAAAPRLFREVSTLPAATAVVEPLSAPASRDLAALATRSWVYEMPLPWGEREDEGAEPERPAVHLLPGSVQSQVVRGIAPDGAGLARAEAVVTPAPDVQFDTVVDRGNLPPDDGIAAGPKHLVCLANSQMQVRTLAGKLLSEVSLLEFFPQDTTGFIFDVRAVFHAARGRFIVAALGANFDKKLSTLCLAVSKNADPTGGWNKYVFKAARGTKEWADFPSLGYDGEAVYVGVNMVSFSSFLVTGNRVFIADLAKAAAGASVSAKVIEDVSLPRPFDPADLVYTPVPAQMVNGEGPGVLVTQGGLNGLIVYHFENPLTAPDLDGSFVDTSDFEDPGHTAQAGSSIRLDAGDTRMQAAVLRDGVLWTCNTISGDGASGGRAAVRFYKVDPSGDGALLDEDTVQSPAIAFSMPSIMPDASGNAVAVFQGGNGSTFGSVYHAIYDGLTGTFSPALLTIQGSSSYQMPKGAKVARWGDYTSAALDVATGKRVWISGEVATSKEHWKKHAARIASTPLTGGVAKVSPTTLNFGKVKVNKSKSLTFTLENTGTGPLGGVVGSAKKPFSVSGGDYLIEPGASESYKVAFKPTKTGSFSTKVKITTSDPLAPTVSVTLKGTGTSGAAGR